MKLQRCLTLNKIECAKKIIEDMNLVLTTESTKRILIELLNLNSDDKWYAHYFIVDENKNLLLEQKIVYGKNKEDVLSQFEINITL